MRKHINHTAMEHPARACVSDMKGLKSMCPYVYTTVVCHPHEPSNFGRPKSPATQPFFSISIILHDELNEIIKKSESHRTRLKNTTNSKVSRIR